MLHVERGYTRLEPYEYLYKNAVLIPGTRYIVRRTIWTYYCCTRFRAERETAHKDFLGAKQNPVPLIL